MLGYNLGLLYYDYYFKFDFSKTGYDYLFKIHCKCFKITQSKKFDIYIYAIVIL